MTIPFERLSLAGRVVAITGGTGGIGSRVLLSDAAPFITGACIMVEGGFTAQ